MKQKCYNLSELFICLPQELLAKLEPGMPIDIEGQKRREELWKEIKA
jgi:hypothetical protein